MKTKIENIATIIAVAIWADGEYDPAEEVTVEEIAEALELDLETFKAEVDNQVKAFEKMSGEQANSILIKAAGGVEDEEVGIVFEAAMQMFLADGELSRSEVSNLLVVAEALGIETEDAILLLADMVKEEEDLEVNLED